MTTITTTGDVAELMAAEPAYIGDAEANADEYFGDTLSNAATLFLADSAAVLTASQVSGENYLLKGSGFATHKQGTITHVEYTDGAASLKLDGSIGWNSVDGLTTGRITSFSADDGLGHGVTLQGSIMYSHGALSGTITKEIIQYGDISVQMSGSINGLTNAGMISSIILHDSHGSVTLTGSYSAAPLIGMFYDADTVDAVLSSGLFFTGNDTLTLADGARAWHGYAGLDKITGGDLADQFFGDDGNDVLYGLAGNDTLDGGAGNDTLDGGSGDDLLTGGLGNDLYMVDSSNDFIVEDLNGGTDMIKSSASFDMSHQAANVESLTLLGTGNLNAIGNDLANTLTGNAGDNTLDGGAGADKLLGGAGNDTYIVDDIKDMITDTAGIDTVKTSINWVLGAGLENLVLMGATLNATGNTLANVLTGNDGDNRLDGGAGNDTMIGGLGDDTYIVSTAGDIIIEDDGAGTDTVFSAASYVLPAHVENITLTGAAAINATGNELANTLIGNTGNNTLDGHGGADQLFGGKGNDTYIINDYDTTVHEDANAGTDTVISSVDYMLGENFENLVLVAAGHAATGNALNNTLTGSSGDDILDGDIGADRMIGGFGNDVYYVDNIRDTVMENANGGIDLVHARINYVLPANVENLELSGAALAGTGNMLANKITGNDLANTLSGMAGDDILDGGLGRDTLIGGAGADIFVFKAVSALGDADVITDFSRSQHDKIDLSDVLAGHDPLADLHQYISISESGGNTLIGVDTTGAGNFTTVATLTHATGLASAGLDALLLDHTIVV